jgi:hypothetical protein
MPIDHLFFTVNFKVTLFGFMAAGSKLAKAPILGARLLLIRHTIHIYYPLNRN